MFIATSNAFLMISFLSVALSVFHHPANLSEKHLE